MPGYFKIAAWILAAILGVALLGAAGVWIMGGATINHQYTAPTDELVHSTDPAVITEGARLATITGCNGCHEERLQGGVMANLPDGSRLVAPNIPRLAAGYTDADLVRAIRYGVKADGRGVAVMPSDVYFALNDDDLIAILSYIRATPDEGGSLPDIWLGLMPRFFFATGEFNLSPDDIEDMTDRPVYDLDDPVEHGEYLASMICAFCHGRDFKGQEFSEESSPPDLMVGAAYSPDEFRTLMRTGMGVGDRDLGMMTEAAENHFSRFTDREIDALFAFTQNRALTAE